MSARGHAAAACLVACLSAGLGAACGAPLIQVDTGVPLSDKDLAMSWAKVENRKSDDFSEQLVVRGVMPDGASLYAKLTVTNLASADGRADLNIAVTLPDGRKLKFREKKEREDWTFAQDRFYAEVGDGSIELRVGHAKIVCRTDDFELEADIASTLPALRPPGGVVKRAAGYYVTTIPIPRGKLSLKVKLLTDVPPAEDEEPTGGGDKPEKGEGEPAAEGEAGAEASPPAPHDVDPEDLARDFDLEGVAYAEHRASTIAPYALAHAWHGILDIGPDRTVVFSAFEPAHARNAHAPTRATKGEPEVQGWIFAAEDDGFVIYEPALELWAKEWHNDEKTNYPLPGLVFVSDPLRSGFEGVVKLGTLSERKDD
ncbi:MAG: hypothetical protein U1F43_31865, partial [Myxococcota bacterium]